MAASPSTTNGTAFVTVTAKVSIVMGIVATLYAAVQVLVALLVLHGGATDSVLAFLATQPSPAGVRWVLSHLVAITVGLLLVSGAFLAVSVGLLRRLSLALAWATALAFGALHALIVWQLCRPHVRAEFGWVHRTR